MQCQANGITIAYDADGSGPAVTLVHALGLDREMWWQQVPALAKQHRTLSYDVRGHGQSGVPGGPYSLDLFAEDLHALLAALGIARTHLVGVSMGGMIAQTFVLRYPAIVASLTLIDTTSGYHSVARQAMRERAAIAETEGMVNIVEPTLERWFTESFRRQHSATVGRLRRKLLAADPLAYAAAARAVAEVNLTADLPRISCPCLIVVGRDDPSTPPEMAEAIHNSVPASQLLVIPNTAHLSPIEQPTRLNHALLRFLQGSVV